MAPRADSQRHHCEFKMPRNPQYECPRAGKMYEGNFGIYYCTFHDRYSKKRCQAFFQLKGSGMQCPNLGTVMDKDTGRKFYLEHDPLRQVQEVDVAEVDVGTAILTDDAPEGYSDTIEKFTGEEELDVPELDLGPQILEPDPELPTPEPESKPELPAGGNESEKENERGSLSEPMPEPMLETEPQSEHIAALYVQCNICLEKHTNIDVNKVEPCGHRYKETCLQNLLRRGDVRRFNCTSCRSWLQRHQES